MKTTSQPAPYDVEKIRRDFPLLSREVHGRPLVYLDNAASTLKPLAVIERIDRYYRNETSNVHRGAHFLSEQGTIAFEEARDTVRSFIRAKDANEIIFTRGTTESINLVAQAWGEMFFERGDEIVLSELEHHSNIVPWQMIAEKRGCTIRVIPIDDDGDMDFEKYLELLGPRTKMVAISWCSNALGTVAPIKKFIEAAHRFNGAKVLIDAAQAVSNLAVDVVDLDCDFFVFSGHKIFGPYGIGALYGKMQWLEMMPPYQGGGSMIQSVTWEKTTWAAVPHKFEAGTPNISGAVGLAAALKYLSGIGVDQASRYEQDLLNYALERLGSIDGLRLIGKPKHRASIVSFVMDGAHPSDVGALIDQQGIAIRAGHHCCQPLMRRLGLPATARASFSIYNTRGEVDVLRDGLLKAKEFF